MKALLRSILEEAHRKYVFTIDAYCILGNHFHLIIRPGAGESLPLIMKWILQVFSIRYNKSIGSKGHFWGDRYYSAILESHKEYSQCFAYINDNPVRAKLSTSIREWHFGGVFDYCHARFGVFGKLPIWVKRLYEPLLAEGP